MCVWESMHACAYTCMGITCVCKAASTHESMCMWRLADSLGCYSMHVFPLSVERGLYSLIYVAVNKFPAQFSLRRKSLFGLQFQVITHRCVGTNQRLKQLVSLTSTVKTGEKGMNPRSFPTWHSTIPLCSHLAWVLKPGNGAILSRLTFPTWINNQDTLAQPAWSRQIPSTESLLPDCIKLTAKADKHRLSLSVGIIR